MTARIIQFTPRLDVPPADPAAEQDQRLRWVRAVLLDAEQELARGDLRRAIEVTTAALNCMVWLWKQRGGAA